nr:rho GTPase-activating protein 44-like [Procambarus clarkii]
MNFGRQLKRVKQQADHLFLRSDRTDVVGELRTAEEQVEELRLLCEAYTRSLEKCLHTHSTADEKKLVSKEKSARVSSSRGTQRSTQLPSSGGEPRPPGPTQCCHKIKKMHHGFKFYFSLFFCKLQVGLDLDAAKTRWRNSQANPGPNAKMDTYREELEEAETKLDQARDTYACDIFSLMAREREITQYMCGYLELQREFMQKTLSKLDRVLPDMRQQLEASSSSPAFGVPLHDHLKITQQEIAVPLQVCVRRLLEVGLFEEGLFRVAGSTSKVRRLKGAFDANLVTIETLAQADEHDRDYDVHVVAGALKCYLRELPEPLLTHVLHDQWLEAVRQADHQLRLKALWLVVNQLPPTNLANLRYLVKFLAKLAANSSCNKMSPSNIAIVMAPNLIWDQRDAEEQPDMSTLGRNMSLTGDYRSIVDHLVEYSDYFFKEEIDFGVIPRVPPSPSRVHAEPNGSLPLSTQHGRTGPQTHRRNASADLTGRVDNMSSSMIVPSTSDSCESPKQPQRTKKKQAPRPPQPRPTSTHGSFGGHDSQISGGSSNSASGSPEQGRSNTPPRETMSQILVPAPAARLHHSNSIRRPTAEPPKPPGAPTKPPRPSPPTVEHLERSAIAQQYSELKPEAKVVPIGFEQIHTSKETDIIFDDSEVVLRKKHTEGVGPIGFVVDGKTEREDEDTSRSFRKSLESVLQLQAAGQPVALPRHNSGSSVTSEGETGPAAAIPLPRLASAGESSLRPVIPPTPVQRTTIPAIPVAQTAQRVTRDINQSAAPDRPEQTQRPDKPALPEKPCLMTRSTILADHPKPLIPERPAAVPHRPSAVTSSVTGQTQLPAPDAGVDIGSKDKDDLAPQPEEDAGSGVSDEDNEAPVLETTHMYSIDKQEVAIVQVGNGGTLQVGGVNESGEKPGKPAKPEKRPNILPRPPSLTSDQLESVGSLGSLSGTSGKSSASGKFTWPPPHDATASPPAEDDAAAAAAPDSTKL